MEPKGCHFGALGRERRESVNRAGTQARASKTRFRRGREGLFFQVFFRPLPGRSPGGEDASIFVNRGGFRGPRGAQCGAVSEEKERFFWMRFLMKKGPGAGGRGAAALSLFEA